MQNNCFANTIQNSSILRSNENSCIIGSRKQNARKEGARTINTEL